MTRIQWPTVSGQEPPEAGPGHSPPLPRGQPRKPAGRGLGGYLGDHSGLGAELWRRSDSFTKMSFFASQRVSFDIIFFILLIMAKKWVIYHQIHWGIPEKWLLLPDDHFFDEIRGDISRKTRPRAASCSLGWPAAGGSQGWRQGNRIWRRGRCRIPASGWRGHSAGEREDPGSGHSRQETRANWG